jgi:hypothetical protein
MAALSDIAQRVGPTHDEISRPLATDEIPSDAGRCPAFAGITA